MDLMSDIPQPKIMDLGPQPLDRILNELSLDNHAIVEAGRSEQLTHKQVQKARRGRRVTPNLQRKITRAVNSATSGEWRIDQLFDY